jgi:hypothetical protein
MRNGAVHILDYNPDARTNNPIAQFALMRLMLGLKLFDFKYACFNEKGYCESLHSVCRPGMIHSHWL